MASDRTAALIELIRVKYEALYDTKHVDYVKTKKKDKMFEEIARHLNYSSGYFVKNEWANLRNRHREALRRQKNKKSCDAGYKIKPWQYQEELSFLIPFMRYRQSDSSMAPIQNDDFDSSQYLYHKLKQEQPQHQKDTDNSKDLEELDHDKEEINEMFNTSGSIEGIKRETSWQDSSLPLKRYREDSDEGGSQMEEHKQQCIDVAEQPTHDALYYFFMSVYEETKKMPTHVQCQLKRKIFNIINEEEQRLLAGTASVDSDAADEGNGHNSNSSFSS